MFPEYGPTERRVDGAIHALGVAGSALAAALLVVRVVAAGDMRAIAAAAVYGIGLVAMFGFSAAYNLAGDARRKEALRRCDHAAIFLMIAGTYTPFALVGIAGAAGAALLGLVWPVAAAGMLLKWCRPRRYERAAIALYLALGWIGLPALGVLIAALPVATLALLGAGGLLYTAGVGVHLWTRLPFHNAVWHVLVLAAAACHYLAVARTLVG